MDDIKKAIEDADAARLSGLLSGSATRANTLITWGKHDEIHTHPLHYVSDMVIASVIPRGKEVALIDALLTAGANVNHQAESGETPLIGAASLSAEDVGLRLLEGGARPETKGAFGETALHWAAHKGLCRLVSALINKGADVHIRDSRWDATPLGWAIHGWTTVSPYETRRYPEVVALLVKAGAEIRPEWFSQEGLRTNQDMLRALRHPNEFLKERAG